LVSELRDEEPKRDDVMGGCRKLHNKVLRDLCSLPSKIRMIKLRRMRWAGNIARIGKKRTAYRLLVGKPKGKRPLGRQRPRRVDNIKMDFVEIGCSGLDWIGLAQDREKWTALENVIMDLRLP
jgi:hypothetical protein